MRRTTLIVTAALALAMVVAVPAIGMAAVSDHADDEADEQANETAPGEQLAGVVGVQEAEIEGDLDKRTFGIKMAQAETDEARADIVAEQLDNVEERLENLEERKADLDERREAGEMREGAYRAQIAGVATQTATAQELTNQSSAAAGELPTDLLEERGINAERISTLQERANELGGPEVAEIARGIAGPGVGDTPADDRPVDVPGAPGETGPPSEQPGEDEADDDEQADDEEQADDDQPGEDAGDGA